MPNSLKSAIFFDRDGVINKDLGYSYDFRQLELFEDVFDILGQTKEHHFLNLIITNQSGVARGKYSLYDVFQFHQYIQFFLQGKNSSPLIDGFYICPHLKDASLPDFSVDCDCRKPKPGLIKKAVTEHHIDLPSSWLIGDKVSDIDAALEAGLKPIQILGWEAQSEKKHPQALLHAHTLTDAWKFIKTHL